MRGLLASSGLPDTPESLETLSAKWIEKRELFQKQIRAHGMVEGEFFRQDDPRGALLLTYSGSLITVGTLADYTRWVEYASIKLRTDVPDSVKSEKVQLTGDILVDQCTGFEPGLLKRTSEILTIAYCTEDLGLEEQEERIKQATLALTEGFVKINRD